MKTYKCTECFSYKEAHDDAKYVYCSRCLSEMKEVGDDARGYKKEVC